MHLFIGEIQENQIILPEVEAHHAKRVLRLEPGTEIMVTNGFGDLYLAKLESFSGKIAYANIFQSIENQQKRNYNLTLAVAPTKQMERIEFFLEKAVEIGLDSFQPLVTFHSERRKINLDRLEKIAISAMKQSMKAEKPVIQDLMNFDEFIQSKKDFSGQKFIAHCYDDLPKTSLKQVLKVTDSYLFLIGPEGDFSRDEVNKAIELGFEPISLGKQRLRTETAALSCVSFVNWINFS